MFSPEAMPGGMVVNFEKDFVMSLFCNLDKANQKQLLKIEQQQMSARRKIERDVCALISRGNISLQQGEYITQDDMDLLQNELVTFFSSKQSEW